MEGHKQKQIFPPEGHLTEYVETIGDKVEEVEIRETEKHAYFGDFPPKDTYKKDIQ